MDAVDAKDVWAATQDHLLHSTDGVRFERLSLPALDGTGPGDRGISALDFVSRDQGFVLAGANGLAPDREDPGENHPSRGGGFPELRRCAHRFHRGRNRVYKTTDGGRTFTSYNIGPADDPGVPASGISFPDATHGWLVGDDLRGRGFILFGHGRAAFSAGTMILGPWTTERIPWFSSPAAPKS